MTLSLKAISGIGVPSLAVSGLVPLSPKSSRPPSPHNPPPANLPHMLIPIKCMHAHRGYA